MTISISQKLMPFSHLPGSSCLIPGTPYEVEAFPALVRLYDVTSGKREIIKEKELNVTGPVGQFTLMQNLEKGCVTIFSDQYYLHILPDLEFKFQKKITGLKYYIPEVLSLGSHKKQDWDQIKKRLDFREIFPIWFRLGIFFKNIKSIEKEGVFSLLDECRQIIEMHHPEKIIPSFEKLFLASFRNMMVPRLCDEDFQGIINTDSQIISANPLYLLKEASHLIRSLFITSFENEISILPNLPPEFFSGRMIRLKCESYGEIDLEWTKKTIRRVIFRASRDGELYFHFKTNLKSFRFRRKNQQKGVRISCSDPLQIIAGQDYLLDQFQK